MGGREGGGRPASMTGQRRGDQQWSRCIFAIRQTCHIPKNLTIPQVGGPASASPVSGTWFSSRPGEKGVGGRDGEAVLEFSCPNQLGTTLVRLGGCDPTSSRRGLKRWEQGGWEQQKQATPLPREPATTRIRTRAIACRTTCSCMTTIGVTASTTGSQRRASRGLFPWLDVRDCPKRTATPPRENPGRPETERLTRACQAQLSQPVSHPVHNPVRSSVAPRSSFRFVPIFACLFSNTTTKNRPVSDLQFHCRPVGQPNRHKSTTGRRSSSIRLSSPDIGQRACFRTTSQSCLLRPSARDAASRRALRCTESVR